MPYINLGFPSLNVTGATLLPSASVTAESHRFRRNSPVAFPDPLPILVGTYRSGASGLIYSNFIRAWLYQAAWTLLPHPQWIVASGRGANYPEAWQGFAIAADPRTYYDRMPIILEWQSWVN